MNIRNLGKSGTLITSGFLQYEKYLRLIALTSTIIIASCGSDNGVDYKNEQGEPVANAQALLLGSPIATEPRTYQSRANSEITLTGKDSDSDYAPILDFTWEQIDSSGYAVELIERNDSTSAFDSPNVNAPTQLQFRLTITDANGKSDDDLVYINITPGDDANHFLSHPGNPDSRFFLKAVLDAADYTEDTPAGFTFDVITIAHWVRRDGSDDEMEIKRQTINGTFPANFVPDLTYDGINDPRNPAFTINIPLVDADDINKHFETVERERRVERYLIDDIVLETKIELVSTGGKIFEFFALNSINPSSDLASHIINLSNLVYDGPSAARIANRRPAASKLLDSSETEVSLSVTKLLSAMGLENYITASNYYLLLDSLYPDADFETLEGWFDYAGFKSGGEWVSEGVVRALYVNNYDLGFGRDMYSRTDEDGNVYTFVVNYPSMEAGMNKLGEFAVVAMEYSDNPDPLGVNEKIVKFFAYIYDERKGGFVRAKSLNFDGRGENYVPGACTGCHQGISSGIEFLDVADADLGATFLPWDVSAFLFADAEDPKYIESTLNKANFAPEKIAQFSREAQEEQIRQLNLHALATYVDNPGAHTASIELIHGWYGDESNSLPVDELPASTFNEDFTPAGWITEPDLYHDVFAGHCRMCHTQLNSALKNFDTYNEFINNSKLINYVYERGLMPLARMTMDRFWSSIYNSTSAADILRAHLESLDKTVPLFPGKPTPAISILPGGVGIATIDDIITIDASASLFSTSYSWSLLSPFGSTTTLGSTTGPVTSFQADMPGGDYVLELTVYNANGDSDTLNTTISIIDRTPIAECLTANTTNMTAAGALDNIPVVSQLTDSLGDGDAYISGVINGTYGTASIDPDTQTISYQLADPFVRGEDIIYYQVTDIDGSTSTTDTGCNNDGNTGYARIIIDSTLTGELNPGSLTATLDNVKDTHEIDLSWSAPTAITAESYKVYRVGNSTAIATVSAPTTSYSHTGLTPDTAYEYEVTAVIANAESNPSNADSATTLALLPGTLAAPTATTSQIDLTWSAPTGNVNQYKVYLFGNNTALATITAPATGYSHTGLIAGKTYDYVISGVDALPQESAKTDPVSKTTIPNAPTGLTLALSTRRPTSEIHLDWIVPAGQRDHFCIYRDGDAIGSTTNNSYRDSGSGGLASYRLYSYHVTAIAASTASCIGVESASSNTESIRTEADGGSTTEPVLDSATVDAVNDASEIDLAWTPATSYTANGYKVYRDDVLIATLANVTSYADAGLSYDNSYTYKITALYDPGNGSSVESNASNSIVASTENLIPGGVGGSATSTSAITVNWSAPAANVDSAGYTIYRNGSLAGTSTGSATSFNDSGLAAGTSYSYTVAATQGSQTSAQSTAGNVATKPNTPAAPLASRDGASPATAIDLSWSAPSGGSGTYTYTLERATNAGFTTGLTTIVSATTATSVNNDAVSAGTQYYYRVTATINGVASDPSSGTAVASKPNTPSAPSVSRDVASPTTAMDISWSAPSGGSGTYSYTVERATSAGFSTGLTTVYSGASTSLNNDTVSPGTLYYYRVTATINSVSSDASTGTSQASKPSAPTGVSINNITTTGFRVNWTDDAAGTYTVYVNGVADAGSTSGSFLAITGKTYQFTYDGDYSITVTRTNNSLESSASSAVTTNTLVSFSRDIQTTCVGCHSADTPLGSGVGYYKPTISPNFPACITTNDKACSEPVEVSCSLGSNGQMCFPDDSPERQLIRDWLNDVGGVVGNLNYLN